MVISSSPARSNDQSLNAARRSTTSRGLPDSLATSMSDMRSPRFGLQREAHAHLAPLKQSPGESPAPATIHRPSRGPKNSLGASRSCSKDSRAGRNRPPTAVHSGKRDNSTQLVSRFRSSPEFAARSVANFGIEGH